MTVIASKARAEEAGVVGEARPAKQARALLRLLTFFRRGKATSPEQRTHALGEATSNKRSGKIRVAIREIHKCDGEKGGAHRAGSDNLRLTKVQNGEQLMLVTDLAKAKPFCGITVLAH